ncbi:MAG: TIGR01777 family oxidoreductase [Pseudomonadota bacterium]
MHILVAGGTGLIGSALIKALLERGEQITLLARNFDKAKVLFNGHVSLVGTIKELSIDVDAVVNLAGEPIMDKRWTASRKQKLKNSRIGITQDIVQWIAQCKSKPQVLINGSAIGYYGHYPEDIALDENAKPRPCFSSELCQQWEQAAAQAVFAEMRVCTVRTGVVLTKQGGALKRMLPPFYMGLGGPISHGRQWFSWIHINDMVKLLLFLLDNDQIKGPVNATAPNPMTNYMFSKTLGKTLRRPALLSLPARIVSLLLGEAAELLLEGQKVVPQKLLKNGFEFDYPTLDDALQSIFDR